jgi:creatinine amidohydrolase
LPKHSAACEDRRTRIALSALKFIAARSFAAGLVALIVTASLPEGASAATASAPTLEELTWTELRDEIKSGKTTILVPIGGTEQNGPHMALGKHNVRVKHLAGQIAAKLGNAVVAPVLGYVPQGSINPPTQHMRFPGTITIPDDVFEKVLESAARGFRLHGFRNIVLLGDSGGYQKNLRAVAERLNREWAKTSVRVHAIEQYYLAAQSDFPLVLQERGFRKEVIGSHAGMGDTALTLAIDPGLVRREHLRTAPLPRPTEGVIGDPRPATAQLGQLGVDLIVERTVQAIRAAVQR